VQWGATVVNAGAAEEQFEAGTSWVNTHMQLTHDAPFTGMKRSGLGSEMGLWSIYAYADPQTVFRTRSQTVKQGAPEAW
jgi:acyl-CoA reductase-like NAD-dependent aldehyde dehydrogenase